MTNHHFISYSSADALDFALKLADALSVGPPPFPAWIDKRRLVAGQDWDVQLREAIRSCASLIFVMSYDSVEDLSVCKEEWRRALSYKKPVTPLLYHAGLEKPFGLGARQHIDFTGDFERGLAQLRTHLSYLASPAGELHQLQLRLADAQRDQRRTADPNQLQRIADEIALLRQQIDAQEYALANPAAAAQAIQQRIETGLERERKPAQPVSGAARTKFINPPPGAAPAYFQDRHVETRLLVEQLHDPRKRLLTVVGRGGVGKTAMICRLLKEVERARLPDNLEAELGPLAVDGLVYLNQNGTRLISADNLFADLGKLLPPAEAQALAALARDPQVPTAHKVKQLLTHFTQRRVLVLLDNLEDLIDPATRQVTDAELDAFLRTLLSAPVHGVTVIATTRIAPQGLALVQPQLQYTLPLDDGLASPYAEAALRAMDPDGKLGLRDAPTPLLTTARKRTRGYPRALEALVAILSSDRATTLPELLGDKRPLLPEYVVETLVGEAYSRLDRGAQLVMQALALYARPVTPAAIDFLLQPHLPTVDAAATLNRLVNMHFARKEGERYYLHPVDRSYALAQVPEGTPGDGSGNDAAMPPYTRYALWSRGADYFANAKLPRSEWKQLSDLDAQLTEFDLRCAAQEYGIAADVLSEIDFSYLLMWGHARLLVQLHGNLQGQLTDPRQLSNHLGNLSLAYHALGQLAEAITYVERALATAKECSDRSGEAAWLNNLGNIYSDLGELEKAIDYYKEAFRVSVEIGDHEGEGNCLGNLGNAYAALDQLDNAIECQRQGVELSRELGARYVESCQAANLGYTLLHHNQLSEALEMFELAIFISDEYEIVQTQSDAKMGLAMAQLISGDLTIAEETINAACQYDYPLNNADIRALQGVIQLRLSQTTAAQEAFTTAIAQANGLLAQTPQLYAALDTVGLAQAGLALCGARNQGFDKTLVSDPVAAAINAYRAARVITRAPGIVARALRLFDALAVVDGDGVLVGVRAAVAGKKEERL